MRERVGTSFQMLGRVFMSVYMTCKNAKTNYRRYVLEQMHAHKKGKTAGGPLVYTHVCRQTRIRAVFRDVKARCIARKQTGTVLMNAK